MPRILILSLLLGPFALLFGMIFVASNALDSRGAAVTGTISDKREYVSVRYSHWKLTRTVTVQYPLLETGGYYFNQFPVSEDRYDRFHKGESVAMHYLRKRDLPALPLFQTLWQMHVLPRVRLADETTASAIRQRLTPSVVNGLKIARMIVLLLTIWRMLRIPYWAWVVGFCLLGACSVFLIQDFPLRVPAPSGAIRQASARIVGRERIDKLFSGVHEQGFVADQPVEVVAAEFVPAGRTEAVVAVDLIDASSLGPLTENRPVVIDYQENAPRIAGLQGATRQFPERNLRGMAIEGVLCVLALLACLVVTFVISKTYRRLVARKQRPA